jgi:hypothetical protein
MQWPRGSETPELPIASNVGTMLWVSRYHLFQTHLLVLTDNIERVGQEKKTGGEKITLGPEMLDMNLLYCFADSPIN